MELTKEQVNLMNLVFALKEAEKFIQAAHHRDGCQKARESWKECTCNKDNLSTFIAEILENIEEVE